MALPKVGFGDKVRFDTANITGTTNPDILTGTALADLIEGLASDDVLYGFDASDRLLDGSGDDIL